jgi:hypothetical protein
MRVSLSLLLLFLILLALTLSFPPLTAAVDSYDEPTDEYVEEETPPPPAATTGSGPRAKLIIHKRLITPIPNLFAAQRPINVSIVCYNVGTLAAYGLTIGDNWGDLFEIVEGSNVTEVDVLEAGEVTELNFTVVPAKEGHFTGGAATVSYQAEGEGSRLQQAYSSGYRSFTVYPLDVYERYSRSKTVSVQRISSCTANCRRPVT